MRKTSCAQPSALPCFARLFTESMQLEWGAADRALAVCGRRSTVRTVWLVRTRPRSARGRAEPQPGRLRSPFIPTASFRLQPNHTQAETNVWVGGGIDLNCSTAENWTNSLLPTPIDDVLFYPNQIVTNYAQRFYRVVAP